MKETLYELLKDTEKKQLGKNEETKMTIYNTLPIKSTSESLCVKPPKRITTKEKVKSIALKAKVTKVVTVKVEVMKTDVVVIRDFYKKFYNSLGKAPNRCSSSIGKTRGLLSFSRGIGWEGLIMDTEKKQLGKNEETKMTIYNTLPIKSTSESLCVKPPKSGFTRFNAIMTSFKSLDLEYSSKNRVRNFLRALPLKYKAKVMTIEEAKDLATLPLDELIFNLKVYELVLDNDDVASRITTKEKVKSIALKAKVTKETRILFVLLETTSNLATRGDENPIRTLRDYFKPSYEGYKNTIPVGNNMCEIDHVAGGKLHNNNADESWEIIENLALYDHEGWKDTNVFAKPVKAISTSQGISKTPDRRLLEHEDQLNFSLKGPDMEVSVKESETKNRAKSEAKNKPIKNPKKEEVVEAPSSRPVEYYLKHRINEKPIEGLVDNSRFNDSLSGARAGKKKGKTYNVLPRDQFMKQSSRKR
nr:UBN2 domain-containing protein [Tanacetum cinerariifolium]